MVSVDSYKNNVLQTILEALKPHPDILAAWEGGSAATKSKDQYSDLDLCLLSTASLQEVLDRVEKALAPYHITAVWKQNKSGWGEGILQRFMMLKDAPKHFFVDVAVFDLKAEKLRKEFLEVERHGEAIVHFDKNNLIHAEHTNFELLTAKQKNRYSEITQAFPFYKTLVLKEIDRRQAIDAMSFYQNGLLRPLVEVLGMKYRTYKFDFALRYVHRHFPEEVQCLIQSLTYVTDLEDLKNKVFLLEKTFNDEIKNLRFD